MDSSPTITWPCPCPCPFGAVTSGRGQPAPTWESLYWGFVYCKTSQFGNYLHHHDLRDSTHSHHRFCTCQVLHKSPTYAWLLMRTAPRTARPMPRAEKDIAKNSLSRRKIKRNNDVCLTGTTEWLQADPCSQTSVFWNKPNLWLFCNVTYSRNYREPLSRCSDWGFSSWYTYWIASSF